MSLRAESITIGTRLSRRIALAHLEPVELGEHHVEDDRGERALAEAGEPVAAVGGGRDLEAGLLEPERGHLANRRIVLDQQHALVHRRSVGGSQAGVTKARP